MPIYEYKCPKCGRFECLQKITAEQLTECPTCLSKGMHSKVERLVSMSSFRLKGTGWYQTDYGSGSSGSTNGNGSSNGNGKHNGADTSSEQPKKTDTPVAKENNSSTSSETKAHTTSA